jgi:hypothetical protein
MGLSDILTFMQMARDIATCMFFTGLDRFTQEEAQVARHVRDRRPQRALL